MERINLLCRHIKYIDCYGETVHKGLKVLEFSTAVEITSLYSLEKLMKDGLQVYTPRICDYECETPGVMLTDLQPTITYFEGVYSLSV